MHTPSLIHGSLFPHREERAHRRSALRKLHANLRGWARSENVVASFSLAVVVTIVLALLYQALTI
jgi:hypothetical protein